MDSGLRPLLSQGPQSQSHSADTGCLGAAGSGGAGEAGEAVACGVGLA